MDWKFNNCRGRNHDRDAGYEINDGADDGNPTHSTPHGMVLQVSGSESAR
jgi:hypothetical protein